MIAGINSFFMSALNWIYSWVGNYGWSVVVFTIMIRVILLPLDVKSRKSMRDMNRIQPQVQELQKKYADDKDKLNKKTMELYQKENVKMSAGCLPLLLQYPILIFMFTAMRVVANEHTVQMILDLANGLTPTLQSWLWIKNVFQPDSFTVTILPAVGSELSSITAVSYSSILTDANIEAAREFLATSEYAAIAAEYGANAFTSIELNFIFIKPTLTIPSSISNLIQYANGLFILPVLAAVSQFLMTTLTNGKQTPEQKAAAEANPSQSMNNGFMKWFFPLFSLWICASSNSAFSIYWMAVNVFMIIENLVLNFIFDRQDAKREAERAIAEANTKSSSIYKTRTKTSSKKTNE